MNQRDPFDELHKMADGLGIPGLAAAADRARRPAAVLVVLWMLVSLALTAGLIYVVVHFLAKWW